jgi:hypothetical protein
MMILLDWFLEYMRFGSLKGGFVFQCGCVGLLFIFWIGIFSIHWGCICIFYIF